VRAIVFRVDSPGGSYVGSDEVWREVVHARAEKKPVIVTMGNVAGSGGYFVAMAADKIVAEPGTITGSIGVLGGKLLTNGLWGKVGVSWDEVHDGENARMFSALYDYSPAEWKRFQAMLDRIYDDFTTKVAEGRKLPKARVHQIAKGRIWSGEDAKALGLVDELGGYATALRLAREAAHLPPDAEVELKVFPRERSALAQFFAGEADSSDKKGTAEAAARAIELMAPLLRTAKMMEQDPSAMILSMPSIEVR
jgi:protease-4